MKKILLGISLTLATFNSNNVFADDLYDCSDFKINQLLEKMKSSTEFFAKNPFDKNCLPFVMHTKEVPSLTIDDFKGSKKLFDEYNLILKNQGFEVITLYNPSSGSFYQFFKLDEETPALKQMKDRWIKNNSKFAVYFDDFIKLHEITHLDFEAVKDIRNNHNAMESIADVSAVILLSFENKFTVKETIEFLSAVRDIRLKSANRKVGLRNNLAGNIQDGHGFFANEVNHIDRKIFSEIIRDLNSIKNQDQILKETEKMNDLENKDVVKFVKKNYYKK